MTDRDGVDKKIPKNPGARPPRWSTSSRGKKTRKKHRLGRLGRLGRDDVDATTSRRAHFISFVIHSFIHPGRGGESATRVTANERNGWVR